MTLIEISKISSLLDVKKAQGPEQTKEKKGNPQMTMALVFIYLLQTAMTETDSAISKSKQMDALSSKELQANKEAEQLHFEDVRPDVKHYRTKGHVDITTRQIWQKSYWTKGSVSVHYVPGKKKTRIENKSAIAAAQGHNDEISAERSVIEEKMGVFQQEAQGDASAVNTIVQQSTTTMKEGSGLLDMVRSLTFKALLTRDIQG